MGGRQPKWYLNHHAKCHPLKNDKELQASNSLSLGRLAKTPQGCTGCRLAWPALPRGTETRSLKGAISPITVLTAVLWPSSSSSLQTTSPERLPCGLSYPPFKKKPGKIPA